MLTFINFCRCTFYYQINQKVKNVFALHKHMQQLFNVGNIPIRNTSYIKGVQLVYITRLTESTGQRPACTSAPSHGFIC